MEKNLKRNLNKDIYCNRCITLFKFTNDRDTILEINGRLLPCCSYNCMWRLQAHYEWYYTKNNIPYTKNEGL